MNCVLSSKTQDGNVLKAKVPALKTALHKSTGDVTESCHLVLAGIAVVGAWWNHWDHLIDLAEARLFQVYTPQFATITTML